MRPRYHATLMERPIIVKFLSGGAPTWQERWLRQFPGGIPRWGNCQFVLDENARTYDWLVVFDDLPRDSASRFSRRVEELACPRGRTILVTTEPSSIKTYGNDYLAQFGILVTYLEPWSFRHPNAIPSHGGEHWHYGLRLPHPFTYDELKARKPPAKDKAISVICSSKQERHTLHFSRYAFVQRLIAAMPEIDVFGRGVRPVQDKSEAIDPYRYHIAIENQICPHYWSEKLADTFLAFSLPIYAGCPNVGDYFPPESYIPIDIHNFDASLATIRETLATDPYVKRMPAILEARRLVLDEHNLFALLTRVIRDRDPGPGGAAPAGKLYSRHALRRHRPLTTLNYLIEKIRMRARHAKMQANQV
jgi:hypothetical protein